MRTPKAARNRADRITSPYKSLFSGAVIIAGIRAGDSEWDVVWPWARIAAWVSAWAWR